MKLLFVLDPLATLKKQKDTSIAMMQEAGSRGHSLYICEQHDIFLRQADVKVNAQAFQFSNGDDWCEVSSSTEVAPSYFDAILMRKDPPFNNEYLYSTYLLELAINQDATVINNPSTVRSWNEKLSVAKFPTFAPAFLVSSDNGLIRSFLAEYQDIVVKPLDGMGGTSIFRLTKDDPNISVILETITKFGQETIMAQQYLPAIKQGDKRIIVINGEPIPYSLARIPKPGETRGNLAAGGKGVAQALTNRDIEIATTVGQTLKAEGLIFVGLDIIGEHLTEINVTSPTGIVEIAAQTDCNPAAVFLDTLESITV